VSKLFTEEGIMSSQSRHLSDRKNLIMILLLCVSALALRLWFLNHLELPVPVRADAKDYLIYAYNLTNHGTYSKEYFTQEPQPDAWRSPGYPLVVALGLLIGGSKHYYAIMIYFQIVISTLCVAVTYFLGRRLMPNWAALSAAGLVAFCPHLISISSNLLAETLFAFVLLVGIQTYYRALERKTLSSFLISALLFGYAYLTNETSLFIPGIFALVTGYLNLVQDNHLTFRRNLWFVGSLLFIFCLFPTAWMLRNSHLPPGAPRGSGRAIATMSHGAYPGFVHKNPALKYFPFREDPLQPAFSASFKNFRAIFWDRFKQRPVRYICWYLFEKPYYLWSWDNRQSQRGGSQRPGYGDIYIYPVTTSLYLKSIPANLTRQLMKLSHPFILILALVGIGVAGVEAYMKRKEIKIDRSSIFLFSILVYYTGLYTIFAPWPRYSVPLRPELYLCAMWTASKIRTKFWPRSTPKTSSV
jgi:4-amino-4-deoxy-L-arabinose transferase-like glycosyltransferase